MIIWLRVRVEIRLRIDTNLVSFHKHNSDSCAANWLDAMKEELK